MHPTPPPADRSKIASLIERWHERLQPYSWRILVANLIAQIGIVVTGGAVRLSGSGLGCSTWPQCEPGSFIPVVHEESSFHMLIEFGNRLLTFVLAAVAILAILAVALDRSLSNRIRRLPWIILAGIAIQGVVGGLSVLFELNPAIVGFHFLISMVLVALSTYLLFAWRFHGQTLTWSLPHYAKYVVWFLVASLVVLLVLGVLTTGSGPHSGDDTVGYRFALDPALMARFHAMSVWVFMVALIALIITALRTSDAQTLRRALWLTLAASVFQGAVGYVQYFTGLPEVIVGIHMLGSGLVTAATTWAVLHTRQPLSLR